MILNTINNDAKDIASDANGSNILTASDLSKFQKLILGLIPELPNDVPGYFIYPSEIDVPINPGETEEIELNVYRTGNVNY